MSRIGLSPIIIPQEVSVNLEDNSVSVKGPKGEQSLKLHHLILISQKDSELKIARKSESKLAKSLHGTYQRLVSNLVTGVTNGFSKSLELVGTGYRVVKQGDKLVFSLGFSHPVEYQVPKDIQVEVEGNNKITVSGINKQSVGQAAASIRAFRPPEPYKGKGIRYQGEVVRRKAGKAAKTAA